MSFPSLARSRALHVVAPRMASRAAVIAAAMAAAALVAGCANYAPTAVRPGQSAADVEGSMGAPTARHALPGGASRLEYAHGPFGRHTYMVDLDANGRVTGWTQVLTEARFNALRNGMDAEAVRTEIGRPSEVFHIGWQDLDVWAYRYEVVGNFCQWFMVTMGKDGRVAETSYGPDPMCNGGPADGDKS